MALRNRIITAPTPRMATKYSFNRKIQSFHRAIFLQGLHRIFGTSGRIPARSRCHRRDTIFVEINGNKSNVVKKRLIILYPEGYGSLSSLPFPSQRTDGSLYRGTGKRLTCPYSSLPTVPVNHIYEPGKPHVPVV